MSWYQQLCLYHYFGDHKNLYISSLFCFSFVTDNAKPTCLNCVNNTTYNCILSLLKLHRTLFYELDVLYIFDINIVCPYEICKFIWILIWKTSTIRNRYACLILLIQLWGTKIDIALFLSSLMLRKVDSLQKFRSRRDKMLVCILIFLVFSKSGIQY